VNSAPLVDRLGAHRTLAGVPSEQLAWLAVHGRLVRYEPGQVVTSRTGPVLGLFIVLSGHLTIRVDRGAGPRKVMEWHGGDVTGLLPYSRLKAPPGDVIAEEPTEALLIEAGNLRELARECHDVTAILVHVMVDRARHFTSTDLHDEKMLSLGRLAAGLAHELNNPASALVRDAKELTRRLGDMEAASRSLGATLRPEQLALVDRVTNLCLTTVVSSVRAPLAQMDREDAFRDWLDAHGADPSAAEPLAETALSLDELDALAANLDREALDAALRSAAATCLVRRLATDMESAASRIHELVSAVKGFTYMDHASVPAPVDLTRGLSDTLAVLRSKARAKSVEVALDVEPDLPQVDGYGGELNQVWVNLIDNALDAVASGGRVDVLAARSGGSVVIRVIDNGPGIPDTIRERIFDPFFTTKPVGQGTGLGLDLVRRLVRRHEGTVDVDSRPGRTEFRVELPLAAAAPPAR
jgi:signal transduction histidine kinase